MGKAILAMIVTIIVGFMSSAIFANWVNAPEWGVVLAVAVMGAFIIYFNDKKQFSKSAKECGSMAISAIFSLLSIGLLGGLVYLFVLIVKALRKYINSDKK